MWIEQVVEETSKGGIIIANTERAKMPQGAVVAIGPGKLYVAAMNAAETGQTGCHLRADEAQGRGSRAVRSLSHGR